MKVLFATPLSFFAIAFFAVVSPLILVINPVFAKDVGVVGQVYPIKEEDLLSFIQKRFKEMKQTGEYDEIKATINDRVKANIDRPMPVAHLSPSLKDETHTINPSILLQTDLIDGNGKLIYPAGTTVNPLEMVSLKEELLFIDGDNKKQLQWAKDYIAANTCPVKIILVSGSIKDALPYFKQPVYFDQQGKLSIYFQLKHTPAIVKQQNKKLEVHEVKV